MQCPYRGCFDTPDVYLDYSITFLKDSNYTAAVTTASNAFNLQFCLEVTSLIMGTDVRWILLWILIRFTLFPVSVKFEGRDGVLDIKYDVPLCTGRRRLSEKSRRLGTFQI